MQKRILGRGPQALEVSALGYGCMGLSHAYGAALSDAEARTVLDSALDAGYTFFDTAEVYGTESNHHHNEDLLGKILGPKRQQVVLASKFGLTFDLSSTEKMPYPLIIDCRPETIRKSIDGSLQRLKTDHLDLYYQHRPDPKVEPEAIAEVMQELIKAGKILHWGVSEAPADYIRRAHKVCPLTAIQNRYSMMARWHEEMFPMLEELGIGFVAFSPLANGLLSNSYTATSSFDARVDYRASMTQFQPDSYKQNEALLKLLQQLAQEKQATASQISLAWVMHKRPWIVPIPGSRKVERVKENAQAAAIELSAADMAAIDQQLANMSMSGVFGDDGLVFSSKN